MDGQGAGRSDAWKRRRADIQNISFVCVAAQLTAKRVTRWEGDEETVERRRRHLEDPERYSAPVFHDGADHARMKLAMLALHELIGDRPKAKLAYKEIAEKMADLSHRTCSAKTAERAIRDLCDESFVGKEAAARARCRGEGGDSANIYLIAWSTMRDMAAEQGVQGLLFAGEDAAASAPGRGRPDSRSGGRWSADEEVRSAWDGTQTFSAGRVGQPDKRSGGTSPAESEDPVELEGTRGPLAAGSGRPDERSGADHGSDGVGAPRHGVRAPRHGDEAPRHGVGAPRHPARDAPPGGDAHSPLKSFKSKDRSSSSSIPIPRKGGGGRNKWWDREDEPRLIQRLRSLRSNDPDEWVRFPPIVLRHAREGGWTAEQVDELIDWYLAQRIGDVFAYSLESLCATLKHQPPGSRIGFKPCHLYLEERVAQARRANVVLQAEQRDREATEKLARKQEREALEEQFGEQLDQLDGDELRELIEAAIPYAPERKRCFEDRIAQLHPKPAAVVNAAPAGPHLLRVARSSGNSPQRIAEILPPQSIKPFGPNRGLLLRKLAERHQEE
jgi:hypothetical protein